MTVLIPNEHQPSLEARVTALEARVNAPAIVCMGDAELTGEEAERFRRELDAA